MSLKAALINEHGTRLLDETACSVLDANAIVEGGRVTGARLTVKFSRPLKATAHEVVRLTMYDDVIDVHVPAIAATPPSTPTPKPVMLGGDS